MCDQDQCNFHARVEWLGPNSKNQSRKSDKFYEVCVLQAGPYKHVERRRWGKWGAEGQTKEIEHFYQHRALESAQKQIKRKMKKGYRDPVDALTRLAHQVEDE